MKSKWFGALEADKNQQILDSICLKHRKTCNLLQYEHLISNKLFVSSASFVFTTNKDIPEAD